MQRDGKKSRRLREPLELLVGECERELMLASAIPVYVL
jgi:hypothetical protein